MAITRAGYNVFHEAIAAALPTLFVPDEGRDMDRQIDRARFAEKHGLALCLPASSGRKKRKMSFARFSTQASGQGCHRPAGL